MNVCAFKKINDCSDVIMGEPKNAPGQFLVQLRANLSVQKEYCTESEEDAYAIYESWETRYEKIGENNG